jgi:hypothetical protein
MIEPQTALVYTMVMVSAADSDMTDSEIGRIGEMVIQLPVFSGFDTEQLTDIARDCADLLSKEGTGRRARADSRRPSRTPARHRLCPGLRHRHRRREGQPGRTSVA